MPKRTFAAVTTAPATSRRPAAPKLKLKPERAPAAAAPPRPAARAAPAESADDATERLMLKRCAPGEVVLKFHNWETAGVSLARVRAAALPFTPTRVSAKARARYVRIMHRELRSQWVRAMHQTRGWAEWAELQPNVVKPPDAMTVYE
jgi:hypothetical protein